MTDLLRIEYIPLSTVRKWDKNPKRHDIGLLCQLIERHGFKDAPKYEPALNSGTGGIVAGNGRIEALEWMRQQGHARPRGIDEAPDGDWLIPVEFGVDAASQAAAESYGVDHNNATMAGGDYTALDMSRMWTDGYADVLSSLADFGELPLTVDAESLALLVRFDGSPVDAADLWKGMPEFEQEDLESWKAIKVHFANQQDYEAFARLVGQTLTPQTKYIWYPRQEKADFDSMAYVQIEDDAA